MEQPVSRQLGYDDAAIERRAAKRARDEAAERFAKFQAAAKGRAVSPAQQPFALTEAIDATPPAVDVPDVFEASDAGSTTAALDEQVLRSSDPSIVAEESAKRRIFWAAYAAVGTLAIVFGVTFALTI